MLKITDNAQASLQELLDKDSAYIAIRLVVQGDVPGMYRPELFIMREGNQLEGDTVIERGDLKVYVDTESAPKAEGVEIDVINTRMGPRLKFDFPPPVWDDPVANRLQKLLDERINPSLMGHGGFAALAGVNDGVAEIIMGGGCQGCAMSAVTLSDGIESLIKEEVPEIHTVIDGTNHQKGENPYYRDNQN
jgi:Fe/S biogenesis protein NfuA